jgi:squalene synthase HpnC
MFYRSSFEVNPSKGKHELVWLWHHWSMPIASAIDHYENFPVASVLCPPQWRAAVVAIYRVARWADDVADEGDDTPAERLARLEALRRVLQRLWADDASVMREVDWTGLLVPLHAARQRHGLPLAPFLDLLDAFEQDVRWSADGRRYRDDAELLDYCRRSANPVGRLMLHLAGVSGPTALAHSDAICTGLQLVNLWQDLGQDRARGRWYVPDAWLLQAGLDPRRPMADWTDAELAPVVQRGCRLALHHLRAGWSLPLAIGGRFGWELRLVLQGALRVLQHIQALDWRALHQRPTLRARDLPLLVWRAWHHRLPSIPARSA